MFDRRTFQERSRAAKVDSPKSFQGQCPGYGHSKAFAYSYKYMNSIYIFIHIHRRKYVNKITLNVPAHGIHSKHCTHICIYIYTYICVNQRISFRHLHTDTHTHIMPARTGMQMCTQMKYSYVCTCMNIYSQFQNMRIYMRVHSYLHPCSLFVHKMLLTSKVKATFEVRDHEDRAGAGGSHDSVPQRFFCKIRGCYVGI